jgi:hypothetical protein
MAHIRITSPRSHHYNEVLETRKLDTSGAITLNGNLYFRAHEYEVVHVMTDKEKSEIDEKLAAKAEPKKRKRFLFF